MMASPETPQIVFALQVLIFSSEIAVLKRFSFEKKKRKLLCVYQLSIMRMDALSVCKQEASLKRLW